jgi:predicted transposase YbfD/YdcC
MEPEQLRLAAQIFADLPDFRKNRGLNHSLVTLIVIALCAVMSGADTFPEIQTFGETKRAWLKSFLDFRRIPDHDTFRRVFAQLNPIHFQSSALDWIRQAIGGRLEDGDILSIDGKRLRGTSELEVQGIHMVNVWSARQGLCLTATAVEGKGNEITTLPSVLDTLSLLEVQGCIVTIDAMGTQREVARRLVELKADYLLGLKKNQPTLFRDVQEMFDDALRRPIEDTVLDLAQTQEQGHGRVEHRRCWVLPAAPDLDDHAWPGLQSVVLVRSERTRTRTGQTSLEDRYFLSSLPVDAQTAMRGIRTHWEVENKLHWVLDVAFNEDRNQTRKDHGAENLAILRRWGLNLMRKEGSIGGIAKNRKRVGWDDQYRNRLLKCLLDPST